MGPPPPPPAQKPVEVNPEVANLQSEMERLNGVIEGFKNQLNPQTQVDQVDSNALKDLLLERLNQGGPDSITSRNLADFDVDAEKGRRQQIENLSRLGLLREGGDTIDVLGEFDSGTQRGRLDVKAQGQARSEKALTDAMNLLQGDRSLDLREKDIDVRDQFNRDVFDRNNLEGTLGGAFDLLKTIIPGLNPNKELMDMLREQLSRGTTGAVVDAGAGAIGAGAVGGAGAGVGTGASASTGAGLVGSGGVVSSLPGGGALVEGAVPAGVSGGNLAAPGVVNVVGGGGAGGAAAGAVGGTAAASGGFAGAGGAGGIPLAPGGLASAAITAGPLVMFAISNLNNVLFNADRYTKLTPSQDMIEARDRSIQAAIMEGARQGFTAAEVRAQLETPEAEQLFNFQMNERHRINKEIQSGGGEFGGIDTSGMTPEQLNLLRASGVDV